MPGPWEKYRKAPVATPSVSAGPWTRYAKPSTAPAAAFDAPEPPPGAVIHGGDGRSYVADHPEIGVTRTAAPGSRDEAIQQQALRGRAATDGTLSDAARAARPFAQGQSLNFGDELVSTIFGGVEAARGGSAADGFDYGQEFQRQELDRRRQEAPLTSAATEMAGGFVTGAAAAPKIFSKGAGLAWNTVRGAAAGSAGGAAAGFGGGSGMDERIEDAIFGGGIGAGLGAAVPVVGAGVGAGLNAMRSAKAARETLGDVGLGRRTADQLGREMERDGLAPADLPARMSQLGPDGMLLDAGRNLGEGAEAVANLPGAGNKTVRDRLAARTAGAPQRITAAADEAMGAQRNVAETVDDLIARRAAESGPLFDKALNQPIAWNDRLQAFIEDPVIRKGLREGVEIQRMESLANGTPFDPVQFAISGLDEAGDPIIAGVPNMRTLSVAKKGLDNIIESYRDKTSGRLQLDERGRAINSVQRAFLQELDKANPDYGAARAAYAGPTRVRNALGLGQDVFNRSVRPDDLRQRLAGMTDDEREAFKIGARDQLAEIMGTARRDAAAARGTFETGHNREKLGLVLGDDERAGAFLETLGRETDFANRANGITGNSASARRLERAGEYTGRTGAVRGALDPASGLWGDTKRAGAKILDSFIDGRAARSAEEMRGEFGDAVTRQGSERDELLDAIMGYGTRKAADSAKTAREEELMRAILSGGAVATTSAVAP